MKRVKYCLISDADDNTLMHMAHRMVRELEMRGLPDVFFKHGYKAGFVAALRDDKVGLGQVWEKQDIQELEKELDRRFAA